MSKLFKLTLFFVVISITGCASYYRTINPLKINYATSVSQEKLNLSYRYDVLRDAGNKKFVKSEFKNNIRIVAIKLINNSDSTINTSKNILFLNGTSEVKLMDPVEIKTRIQQTWPAYGLFLLGFISTSPLDWLVFGGIGIGNMYVAYDANKKLLNELMQYDITNKEIKPGESVIGIIGFEALHSDPLSVKLLK